MHPIFFQALRHYLKPRPREFHKGDAGHVLIIGGDFGYSGAVRLAAEAALRVGAGLVSIATQPLHAVALNVCRPEMMCHGIQSAEQLAPLIEKASVIVAGPGLGQSDWSRVLFDRILQIEKPLVMDADALNLLSGKSLKKSHWILTPHPGEAARLLKTSIDIVQSDRTLAITELQALYGGVVVLKGHGSLVLDETQHLTICTSGNPGMASAGMGDVLSGVIGGLLAQHVPLGDAAQLGVELHAQAGDRAAMKGERGMIASDLLSELRELVNG